MSISNHQAIQKSCRDRGSNVVVESRLARRESRLARRDLHIKRDQGQNSVCRSNRHNEKPVNRNGNRHNVSATGTAYHKQAQRIMNRHSVSRTGTAYRGQAHRIRNKHSVSRTGTAHCEGLRTKIPTRPLERKFKMESRVQVRGNYLFLSRLL